VAQCRQAHKLEPAPEVTGCRSWGSCTAPQRRQCRASRGAVRSVAQICAPSQARLRSPCAVDCRCATIWTGCDSCARLGADGRRLRAEAARRRGGGAYVDADGEVWRVGRFAAHRHALEDGGRRVRALTLVRLLQQPVRAVAARRSCAPAAPTSHMRVCTCCFTRRWHPAAGQTEGEKLSQREPAGGK